MLVNIFYLIIFIVIFISFIPFFLEMRRIILIRSEWEKNDRKKAIELLLEDINKANERIIIFGGYGNIYNDEKIINALKKKDVIVNMVFENVNIQESKLYKELKEKQNIIIKSTDKKLCKNHFRIIDNDYVYLEKPHLPMGEERIYKRLTNMRFLPNIYLKKFRDIHDKIESI